MKKFHALMMTSAVICLPMTSLYAADAKAPAKPAVLMGAWATMDTNHDNVISKQEYQADSDRRFKELDTDNNGSVTAPEIIADYKLKRANAQARKNGQVPPAAKPAPAPVPAAVPAPAAKAAPAPAKKPEEPRKKIN
jgi:hypothetical protein